MMPNSEIADVFYDLLFPRPRLGAAGAAGEARSQTDLVYELLWKKIVSRTLWPGDAIPNEATAQEAGVSRTPVREAIQRLVQDGLLEQLPRGVRVARLSAEDARDLYDYRTALEVYATRRAAAVVPEDHVRQQLEEAHRLHERATTQGGRDDPRVMIEYQRHDVGLHQLLLYSGGNPRISRAMAAIRGQLSFFHVAGANLPDRLAHGLTDHIAILEALLSRDGDVAARAMEHHIQRVKRRMLVSFFGVDSVDSLDTGRGVDGADAVDAVDAVRQ